ncbi:TetR/AcrR family transcriptional regulator [Herbiconiux sp. A18JL235]|uniref:TetR/AcrR family transcriptional regulator n=1 Tax=Herbiconiux sp. A18JL235 TaxID=3152363 RepID=A0AB39BGZ5_9MICO
MEPLDPLALPRIPLVGPPVAERADAARNRAKLVAAARRIVEREGVAALTTDRLAAEAAVGKGTVFRRFGSRAGIFQALLDDVEREFQGRFLGGPPPLGPGAPAVERLVAFGRARLEVLSRQAPIMRAAELPPEQHYEVPARRIVELHIATLLREAGATAQTDAGVLSFQLLSVLEGALTIPEARLTDEHLARLADGWERLVRAVTRPTAEE